MVHFRNMIHISTLSLFTLSIFDFVSLSSAQLRVRIIHGQTPNATASIPRVSHRLHKRQTTAIVSTCGYLNGDVKKSRTGEPGFGCRVDTSNGLWGFCPTTVIAARDCGLAGYCIDKHSCQNGCGRSISRKDITTVTW